MDPFADKLDRMKARYSTDTVLPPHVTFDLFGTLHAEVHQASVSLSAAWDAITKLEHRISTLEADKRYVNPQAR